MTESNPNAPATDGLFLVASNISKRFGITQALDDVTVSFRRGEVHALMGENGAGKSTLGKVIAGLHKQDSGRVTIESAGPGNEGKRHELKPGSLLDAFHAGVRLVHQELAQCPNLSVAENLCLHALPTNRLGLLNRRAMNDRAARLLAALEPNIDPRAPLGTLSPGHRQIVQIAGALDDRQDVPAAKGSGHGEHGSNAARVIVLDEPTSSLAVAEVERLLAIVRRLASEGITVIYVSHRMGEIFAACDRVSVLRDGKYVATSNVKDIDEATLVEQMIGRRLEGHTRRAVAATSDAAPKALFSVQNVWSPGKVEPLSLSIQPGEILGIGGLVGSGRSELLDAIFGLDTKAKGTVECAGVTIPRGRPQASIKAGLGYVPEDRKLQGLFFQLGIGENIVMPFMSRMARAGVRALGLERAHIKERVTSFQIKAASTASLPNELSGGNQQKLLIARWMGKNTRVLLLDEPTRGIDVGTKSEIYKLVRDAADKGAAVLLVSSEMPELLALSDRIIVLNSGRLMGELKGDEMTQTNILRLATQERRAAG